MAITLEKEQKRIVCESFVCVFKVFVWGNGFDANLFGRLVSNGIGKREGKVVDLLAIGIAQLTWHTHKHSNINILFRWVGFYFIDEF